MFMVHGRLAAVPGQREALRELLAARAAGEVVPGRELYLVTIDPEDHDGVWVTELWDSEDAMAASLDLPEVVALLTDALPLIDRDGVLSQRLQAIAGTRRAPRQTGAIVLDARDPGQESAFWRQLLGAEVTVRRGVHVIERHGSVVLSIRPGADPVPPTPATPAPLHFRVEDINEARRRAFAWGARSLTAPWPSPVVGARCQTFVSPAGHAFNLCWD